MKNLILLTLCAFFCCSMPAQNRVEKPFQIQLNGSGVFLKAFGKVLADSEIDELKVKKWGLPGISAGYHINKRFYLGYSFQPNRNFILWEPWSFGEGENEGMIIVDHNSGAFHSLEGRYFPFRFDLYGTMFFTHVTKGQYNMSFERIGSEMTIGQNSYATDVEADWNSKSLTTLGIGLGYNFVHKSGFSFDLGLGLPIPFSASLYENISIRSAQGLPIDQADLESAKKKIENELFYFPVQFHFSIGYNFQCKKKE